MDEWNELQLMQNVILDTHFPYKHHFEELN